MKITIEAQAEEIAGLVLALQDQRCNEVDGRELSHQILQQFQGKDCTPNH